MSSIYRWCGVGVSGGVSEMLTGGTRELSMGATDCSAITHTENIKDLE